MRSWGIRKGSKSPFKIKLGGRDDLKDFYDFYSFSVRKHKFTDPETQKTVDMYAFISYDEIYKMWDELSANGWIKLFIGTVDDEAICGALVYPFGKIFRCAYWGWNLKYSDYHISDSIQWEMIQWAKANGFQYYDFYALEPQAAEALLTTGQIPEACKKHFFYGSTVFKINFGGKIIKYPGSYIYYSNKMKHLIDTSNDELEDMMKHYKDFYWAEKNFFRDRETYKFNI
jgi:lipid II:glycine glycyltransferase (peptidoglycan interpeptide bridge formation enzyme)